MVLSGMSDMAQILDNTSYMKDFRALNEEERSRIRRVRDILAASQAIQCTNCRYCTPSAPADRHPRYFGLYNNMKRLKNTGYTANQRVYYANLARTHGKASDCIRCGLCEKNCPSDAIHVIDNVAVIDYTKCTSCGTCVAKCPRKVLLDIHEDGKVVPAVQAGA